MSFAKSNDFHIMLQVSQCTPAVLENELTNYIEDVLNPVDNELTYHIHTTICGKNNPAITRANIEITGELNRREYCELLSCIVRSSVWHVQALGAVTYWNTEDNQIQTSAARHDTCYDELKIDYLSAAQARWIQSKCDCYEDTDTKIAVAKAIWDTIHNNETIQTLRIFASDGRA